MITVTIDNGSEKEVIVVRSLIWHGELAQLRTILTAALVKNGNTVADRDPVLEKYTGAHTPRNDIDPLEWC